jgi:DNA-binding NtrC family response regulator
MSKYFQKAGYQVQAVDSAEAAVESVLEKETAVLLLGSSVSEGASPADLVQVLKTCNSQLRIIMVADELTATETRRVREEGIFYQAFKPMEADDTDELRQAVTCAFEDSQYHNAAPSARPRLARAFDPEFSRAQTGKALALIAAVVAVTFGAGALALQARPEQGGSSLTIWIFLGFVALVITNQMVPIFRVKLVLESLKEWKAAHSHRDGKE